MNDNKIHKSIGHWEGLEDNPKWVDDGSKCGIKNASVRSADIIAVTCQKCKE